MALLTRDQILKADDLKTEDVEVPEWGGTVRLRALTGSQRDRLEQSMVQQKGKNPTMNLVDFRAKLLAASAVDESGHLLFSERDIKLLGDKSAAAMDRCFAVAQKLSGFSDGDVEELTEGFDDGPSESSTSD